MGFVLVRLSPSTFVHSAPGLRERGTPRGWGAAAGPPPRVCPWALCAVGRVCHVYREDGPRRGAQFLLPKNVLGGDAFEFREMQPPGV